MKDGTARHVIEGLSQAGDNYPEAIDCLRKRYNRPRLIHRAHVQAILNASLIKTGSGKELRRLHDTVNQHLRALRAMEYDPSGPFITLILELKLNEDVLYKWQRHSHESGKVPHYQDMLDFLDLRAQSTESIEYKVDRKGNATQHRASYVTRTDNTCVACKKGKHPLYTCQVFKLFPSEKQVPILKGNGYCFNCLNKGHISKQCPSSQRCRICSAPHHTWLHHEQKLDTHKATKEPSKMVTSHTSHLASPQKQVLLMTCQLRVTNAHGYVMRARALLDSASSTSFITERLAQHLRLPRIRRALHISGIGGVDARLTSRGIVRFNVANSHEKDHVPVEAVVLPKITAELPVHHIPFDGRWKHLEGLRLADPEFNVPGSVDLLLGADLFGIIMRHGRRVGPPGTPYAFQTAFGWVLAGTVNTKQPSLERVTVCCASVLQGDDLMRKFWEVEECVSRQSALSIEEKTMQQHFDTAHTRDEKGRYIVPLPRKENVVPLGDSRALAKRRFLSLECSLRANDISHEFAEAVCEYFDSSHAETVPECDLVANKESYYMPMHVVTKVSSTTTRMRVVFDASAKSTSGTSLNDHLLVGPTVHPSLVDVLLRFRSHRVALTTDVSRMYRAVLLPEEQRDLHRFIWRREASEPLVDYRITRLTFGVSASSFAANMAIRHNALENVHTYPQAARSVLESFYVDDGLTGANSIGEAVQLQKQLHLFFWAPGLHYENGRQPNRCSCACSSRIEGPAAQSRDTGRGDLHEGVRSRMECKRGCLPPHGSELRFVDEGNDEALVTIKHRPSI